MTSRLLWPLILLTALLAVSALVRTIDAESQRSRLAAESTLADGVASARR